jgi:L-fucose isomerase-like protein
VNQLIREFTPATFTHTLYAVMGEPQRGMQPTLQHTRTERLLRALGINIQPIDQMRIARQQQRQAEQQRREPLYDDPATITGIVNRILRYFGW